MAEKNINVRIQNKSDTSTNWAKATTFIPKKGEVVFYTDLNKIKIGDGSTVVGTLPFIDARNASSADSATNATNLKDSAGSYTYSTLKSALDGKQAAGSYAAASHTHTKSQITDFPSSLKNPYTLKLKDISGTVVNYDGSSAKDLTEGVYYSAYTGSVAYKDIRSPSYDAYDYHGMIGALDAMWDPGFSGNRLAFLDPDTFTIEYSQDSGATWTDSGYDDYNKRCVFADLFGNTPIRIGVGTNGTMPTSMSAAKALQTRLTITNPTHRYCQINRMSLWFSGAHTCYVQVQYALWETPDTFAVWRDWTRISGWSGPNIMSLTARPCFGYSNQVYKIRLVFAIDALNTTYPTNFVCFGNIRFYGDSAWAGGAMHTFPYDWDYQGNIIPNTDHVNSTQTLGVLGKQWKAVYSNYIYAKYAIYFRTGESSNSTYPRILSGDGSSMTVETSGGNAFIFNTAGNISYGLLRPSSTGTYSLGTSSYQWSNVYANGTVYLNGGTITANKTSLSISANGVTPVSLGTNITQDGVDTCTEGVLTFQRGWSDGTAGGLDKTTKLTPYQVDFGGISATWPTTAGTIMTTGLLGNTTTLTTPSTSATSGTAARDYYVGADSNGKLCVYVPWSTTQIANYQGYYLGAATATSVKAWTVVSGGSSGALVVASGTATATTSFLSAGTVSNASPTSTSTTTIACARPYIANAVVELVFFVPAGQTYYLNYYGSWTYLRYGVSRLGTT